MSHRRAALVAIVVVLLVLPGVAWAIHGRSAAHERTGHLQSGLGPPVRFASKSAGLTRPDTLTDPNAILANIVTRYGGSGVVDTHFGGPVPGWTGTEDPSIPLPSRYRDGRWLYSIVAAPSMGSASIRPIWEANLIAGALREELHLAGLRGDLEPRVLVRPVCDFLASQFNFVAARAVTREQLLWIGT